MSKALNNLFWYDGNLADISFSINEKGKSFLQMTAFFYKDEHVPDRDKYQIRCEGVSRFNSSLDAVELKNNSALAIFRAPILETVRFGYISPMGYWK